MQERLGYRKIVYKDGTYTKVVEGECFSEDPFVRVVAKNGDVYVNKESTLSAVANVSTALACILPDGKKNPEYSKPVKIITAVTIQTVVIAIIFFVFINFTNNMYLTN